LYGSALFAARRALLLAKMSRNEMAVTSLCDTIQHLLQKLRMRIE
jgi:hypothetical protein